MLDARKLFSLTVFVTPAHAGVHITAVSERHDGFRLSPE
jgi:hypothetical protein